MLYGGFSESKPATGKWVVTLHEDDYHCLMIVMHIIHGNYHRVPKDLEDCACECCEMFAEDHLYYIARIVDKYDMVHILQPWADAWIRGNTASIESIQATATKDIPCCDAQLTWIAWVLGDEVLLNYQLDAVFFHTGIAEKKRYSDPVNWVPADPAECVNKRHSEQGADCQELELRVNGLPDEYTNLGSPLHNPSGHRNEIFGILNVAGMSPANCRLLGCPRGHHIELCG
jgi:hypothetical protein